jgi:hypothetical protein
MWSAQWIAHSYFQVSQRSLTISLKKVVFSVKSAHQGFGDSGLKFPLTSPNGQVIEM